MLFMYTGANSCYLHQKVRIINVHQMLEFNQF